MARVNLYRDGVYREEHVLMKAVVGVGRHPDNDIILDDPTLSRFHARIERRGATYAVTDLGSSVGVLLNGQRIEGDRELSSGDKLTFGRYDAVFMSEMAPVRRLASREDDGPAPPGGLSSALAAANKGDTTQLSEGSIPQLLLMHHDVEVSRHNLVKGTALVIGRAKDSDVSIPLLGLSRKHAEVSWEGARVRVTDLQSQNGTWVNSQRIDETQFLLHGDRLDFYEYSVVLLMPGEHGLSPIPPTDLVLAASTSAGGGRSSVEGGVTERPASEGPQVMMDVQQSVDGTGDAEAPSTGEYLFDGGADLGSAFDDASDVFGSVNTGRADEATGLSPAYAAEDPLSAWELSGTASELDGVVEQGAVTSEIHTLVGKRSWRGRWLTDRELEEALVPESSARDAGLLASLEVYQDQRLLTQMPFTAGPLRVGSDSRCELSLPAHHSVRPWHATLLRFGPVAICIRGSSQGWLSEDDEEVDQVLLRDGSRIQIGALQLRYRCR